MGVPPIADGPGKNFRQKTASFAPKTVFLGLFSTNPPLRTSSATLVSEPFPKQDKDEVYCRSILRPSLHSLITLLKRWSTLDSVTVSLLAFKLLIWWLGRWVAIIGDLYINLPFVDGNYSTSGAFGWKKLSLFRKSWWWRRLLCQWWVQMFATDEEGTVVGQRWWW